MSSLEPFLREIAHTLDVVDILRSINEKLDLLVQDKLDKDYIGQLSDRIDHVTHRLKRAIRDATRDLPDSLQERVSPSSDEEKAP